MTHYLLLAIAIVMIVYDPIAAKCDLPTESRVIMDWGWRFNAVPFLLGVLMGHWFFPRQNGSGFGWMIALPFWSALWGWDIAYGHFWGSRRWFRYPGIFVLLGMPVGMYLWGQVSPGSPIP